MTTRLRRALEVDGIVQGVGFRPFVHRLATELGIDGTVRNAAGTVRIELAGPEARLAEFERRLRTDAPPAARILDVRPVAPGPEPTAGFTIVASTGSGPGPPPVPADRAMCDACRDELFDPTDRRHRHPFISCTDCGPRFTILEALPYDRATTTMADHPMCAACRDEYRDPRDRRHHAQTIACPECGPRLRWEPGARPAVDHNAVDHNAIHDNEAALAAAGSALAGGAILAVKGTGGFHLAVDATDDTAVAELRRRKRRPDKPFAVMVPDLATAHRCARLDPTDAALLAAPSRPIVLVRARADSPISSEVAPGSPLVGLMLPVSALHHLLFAPGPSADHPPPVALVMTSGNVAGEPICHDDGDAHRRLGPLVDGFLTHDRRIHHPCDDSVVRVIGGRPRVVRRSRGLAPEPLPLPVEVAPVLAVGGDLKNTFCLAAGTRAWPSQHLGDMDDLASLAAFERAVDLLSSLAAPDPDGPTLAADRHPGYRTRSWARARSVPRDVGHHHAHVAALMAEHRLEGTTPVIGFAFDGTGLGDDGTLWGGEVLVADYDRAERRAHLAPVPLPGGDTVVRNPCRVALAHLWAAGIGWDGDLAPVAATGPDERAVLARALGPGTITTSSMGRLFDAVSSLLDVRHRCTYEAQAAIELEHVAGTAPCGDGPALAFDLDDVGDRLLIDPRSLLRDLVTHHRAGVGADRLARAFHEAVVDAMLRVAVRLRAEAGIGTVGLAGGVFQNALLVERATTALETAGFVVLSHETVPPNDGGLALGQAVIAGRRVRSEPKEG